MNLPKSDIQRPRVCINALKLTDDNRSRKLTGNFFHVRELARALGDPDDLELLFLTDEVSQPLFRQVVPEHQIVMCRLGQQTVWRADLAVTRAVWRLRPRLYHRPTGQLPLFPLPCDSIATVADLNFEVLPTPALKRMYKRWSYMLTMRRATRVTCVSDCTRRQLLEHLGGDERKLSVIHHGATGFCHLDDALARRLGPRFFLTFGHQAHKNVEVCLQALRELAGKDDAPVLAVVGTGEHIDSRLKPLVARYGLIERVHFLGRVSDGELNGLYRHAVGLLFMSTFEGFGMPVLEAMRSGCPVISSDAFSLPEVVGDGGAILPPHDFRALSGEMRRLLLDASFRAARIEKGRNRAELFSWERAAVETLNLYRHVLKLPSPDAPQSEKKGICDGARDHRCSSGHGPKGILM